MGSPLRDPHRTHRRPYARDNWAQYRPQTSTAMRRHNRNRSPQRNAPGEPIDARSRLRQAIGLALILLTTFLAYLPAFNGAQIWDDDSHITKPEPSPSFNRFQVYVEFGLIWVPRSNITRCCTARSGWSYRYELQHSDAASSSP